MTSFTPGGASEPLESIRKSTGMESFKPNRTGLHVPRVKSVRRLIMKGFPSGKPRLGEEGESKGVGSPHFRV